jgi:2-dehydro-3-deoxyphosphogluconate aldolase / (4S)-4-hydroxy-2-oxoglutarate aldolase
LAILAGADFVVSPLLDRRVIEVTKRYGKISIPGAMTPTEILSGYQLGADLVKVFPASALSPAFFRDIRGPLGHVPLIATGGIGLSNMKDFFDAGVVAVGIGGELVGKKDLADMKFDRIKEKAVYITNLLQEIRNDILYKNSPIANKKPLM